MRIHHRGLVIELEETDPRAIRIDELIFGRPEPEPAPEPPPPPIPEPFVKFWRSLRQRQQRELQLLAERPYPVVELEKAMAFRPKELRARHTALSRAAGKFGLPRPVLARGRWRSVRRFYLSEETAGWVRRLSGEDDNQR